MWSALLKRHAEGRSRVALPHVRYDSSAISAVVLELVSATKRI